MLARRQRELGGQAQVLVFVAFLDVVLFYFWYWPYTCLEKIVSLGPRPRCPGCFAVAVFLERASARTLPCHSSATLRG